MMFTDRNRLCTSIPGFDDVTDGSVDNHENDWESGNVYPEEEMQPLEMDCRGAEPCSREQSNPEPRFYEPSDPAPSICEPEEPTPCLCDPEEPEEPRPCLCDPEEPEEPEPCLCDPECPVTPVCGRNSPDQTDQEDYEIIDE